MTNGTGKDIVWVTPAYALTGQDLRQLAAEIEGTMAAWVARDGDRFNDLDGAVRVAERGVALLRSLAAQLEPDRTVIDLDPYGDSGGAREQVTRLLLEWGLAVADSDEFPGIRTLNGLML